MNEKMFLCIIKHKEPKVQQRIFSILSQNLEIIDFIERELSGNEYLKLYGTGIPPKKRNQELSHIILLIKGDIEEVQTIIGNEDPCKSPLKSIRYMYGENIKESAIDYWDTQEHERKVELFFARKRVHVAGLNKH